MEREKTIRKAKDRRLYRAASRRGDPSPSEAAETIALLIRQSRSQLFEFGRRYREFETDNARYTRAVDSRNRDRNRRNLRFSEIPSTGFDGGHQHHREVFEALLLQRCAHGLRRQSLPVRLPRRRIPESSFG